MIIETFYITEDLEAINTYAKAVDTYNQWYSRIMTICEKVGFEKFSGADFCVPDYFHRSRFEYIQKVGGFVQVKDKTLLTEVQYILYSLRLDHPLGEEIYREMLTVSQDALADLELTPHEYGTPNYAGYQKAVGLLLGIYTRITTGGVMAFTQVWAVTNSNETLSLICSIPVKSAGVPKIYHECRPPGIWRDISAQEVIKLFNSHNMQMEPR